MAEIKVDFTALSGEKRNTTFPFPKGGPLFVKVGVDIGIGRLRKAGYKAAIIDVEAFVNGTFVPRDKWDITQVPPNAELELREFDPSARTVID